MIKGQWKNRKRVERERKRERERERERDVIGLVGERLKLTDRERLERVRLT